VCAYRPAPRQFAAVFMDITERKQREAELQKLNRTLKALSNSNQAMLHATSETAYLQDVCRIIAEDCGHVMVWIGLAEEDAGRTVRTVAHAGFDAGYLETLNLTWADTERGRGPTGTAIRTGKVVCCADMLKVSGPGPLARGSPEARLCVVAGDSLDRSRTAPGRHHDLLPAARSIYRRRGETPHRAGQRCLLWPDGPPVCAPPTPGPNRRPGSARRNWSQFMKMRR